MGWFRRAASATKTPENARLWRRERDERGQPRSIARRVVIENPRGLERDGFIVEQGTEALLFRNGQLIERCRAGFHKLRSEGSQAADTGQAVDWQQVEVILVEAGDLPFDITLRNLMTRDDVPVDAHLAIPVRVADPALFYRHVIQGQEAVPTATLRQLLFPLARAAAAEHCAARPCEALSPSRERDEAFEGELRLRLDPVLRDKGLELGPLQRFDLAGDDLDKRRADLGAASEREHNLEMARRRGAAMARLRQGQILAEVQKARDEAALRAALAKVEELELLRQSERDEVLRTLRWAREDAEAERADEQGRRARLAEALEAEEARARRRLDEAEALLQLEHGQAVAAREREEQSRVQDHRLASERREAVSQAETGAAVADIRRSEDLKDAHSGEQVAEVERRRGQADDAAELESQDQRVRKALEWQRLHDAQRAARQQGELDLAERERQASHDREVAARQQQLDHELARMKTAGEVPIDALLALQGGDALQTLVELRKTEAFKDMSAEQLQAIAAQQSPELARALAAAHADHQGEVTGLLERMMAQQSQSHERALSSLESLAHAVVQRPAAAPAAAPPPAAAVTVTVACSNCGALNAPTARFCQTCGSALTTRP